MNVTEYKIYRVVTKEVRNRWNEVLFNEGQIVQCVEDLGGLWLARPLNSNSIPRMLPKNLAERQKPFNRPQRAKG